MEIKCFTNKDKNSLLIKVSGECDLYNARDFFNGIAGKIYHGCYNRAIVDLSALAYLDSSGVGAIIRIIKLAKEKQTILSFRGINGMTRKVLDMCNILSLIVEDQ